jgi:hypothetical protein
MGEVGASGSPPVQQTGHAFHRRPAPALYGDGKPTPLRPPPPGADGCDTPTCVIVDLEPIKRAGPGVATTTGHRTQQRRGKTSAHSQQGGRSPSPQLHTTHPRPHIHPPHPHAPPPRPRTYSHSLRRAEAGVGVGWDVGKPGDSWGHPPPNVDDGPVPLPMRMLISGMRYENAGAASAGVALSGPGPGLSTPPESMSAGGASSPPCHATPRHAMQQRHAATQAMPPQSAGRLHGHLA